MLRFIICIVLFTWCLSATAQRRANIPTEDDFKTGLYEPTDYFDVPLPIAESRQPLVLTICDEADARELFHYLNNRLNGLLADPERRLMVTVVEEPEQ